MIKKFISKLFGIKQCECPEDEHIELYTKMPEPDVPFRFVPCMVSGLTYYLAQKYAPQLIQPMKLVYEDEFQRALSEDGSASSTHITPKAYYPGA